MTACALWWASYHSPRYDICDSERDAAGQAWGIAESGNGAVLGVQFPDGRLIERDSWPLLAQVSREYDEAQNRRWAEEAAKPKPVRKQIRDPFRNWPLEVDPSEPDWLGATDK